MSEQLRVLVDSISSSESSDEELFDILLTLKKRKTPKIKNFIEDVVDEYTNNEVILKPISIDYFWVFIYKKY